LSVSLRALDVPAWERACSDGGLDRLACSASWLAFQATKEGGRPVFFSFEDGESSALLCGTQRGGALHGHLEAIGAPPRGPELERALLAFGLQRARITGASPMSKICDTNFELRIDLSELDGLEGYLGSLARDAKRKVKTALRNGPEVGPTDPASFYRCYCDLAARTQMQCHFDLDYFERLHRRLGPHSALLGYSIGGELAAASSLLLHRDEIYAYFLIARQAAFSTGIAAFQVYDLVRRGLEAGASVVNLGPSAPWDGSFGFKRSCRARPHAVFRSILGHDVLSRGALRLKYRWKERRTARTLAGVHTDLPGANPGSPA